MNSNQIQIVWGLLLPIIAFGDEALDIWFLVDNWDLFLNDPNRILCLLHLIIISICQFTHSFWWIGKTNLSDSKAFRVFWGIWLVKS